MNNYKLCHWVDIEWITNCNLYINEICKRDIGEDEEWIRFVLSLWSVLECRRQCLAVTGESVWHGGRNNDHSILEFLGVVTSIWLDS